MRILVAGVGNVLRGDDGFGVRAAELLARDPLLPACVTVIETGIGGMHLVQELMRGYDAVIVLDAFDRGAPPGTLFLIEPEVPDATALPSTEQRDMFADTHYATPIRALALARAVGSLPAVVRILGCQPADADKFGAALSGPVARAIEFAAGRALAAIDDLLADRPQITRAAPPQTPTEPQR